LRDKAKQAAKPAVEQRPFDELKILPQYVLLCSILRPFSAISDVFDLEGQHRRWLAFLTTIGSLLWAMPAVKDPREKSMREYARYAGPGWEMERGSEQNQSSNPLGWFLLGIGVGATVALLLTPSKGRELRSAVGRGFRSTLHALNRGTQQLRRRGSNVIRFSR
jgi:hypothetical protein